MGLQKTGLFLVYNEYHYIHYNDTFLWNMFSVEFSTMYFSEVIKLWV